MTPFLVSLPRGRHAGPTDSRGCERSGAGAPGTSESMRPNSSTSTSGACTAVLLDGEDPPAGGHRPRGDSGTIVTLAPASDDRFRRAAQDIRLQGKGVAEQGCR